ncbi:MULTISPECIES: histidine phosphatase family protein [Lactobacillus]|nr:MULTISPECIES: histidine phosphatase family protein [Lactobacillus]
MKLVIVRHGISADTWDRVVDGDNDPDLSAEGIKAVEKIAPYID